MAFNQQQLEKQGIYEGKAPLPSLLADLEQVGKLAESIAARQRAQAKTGGWIMLAGLIGSIACAAFGLLTLMGLCVLLILFGFGYWIYSYFNGSKAREHRSRVEIARQRLNMIAQDASEKSPFTLRLALGSTPTKLSDEKWNRRKNGHQQCFEEEWFTFEGRLLDGTLLSDEIKELTRKRTFSNARGKSKTKSRVTSLINIRFTYPTDTYGDARPAEKALHEKIRVSPQSFVRGVRVTEKAIIVKAIVKTEGEIVQTLGMLSVGAYRILNLARRMAAGQRGTTK